jgi:hypothetical protein
MRLLCQLPAVMSHLGFLGATEQGLRSRAGVTVVAHGDLHEDHGSARVSVVELRLRSNQLRGSGSPQYLRKAALCVAVVPGRAKRVHRRLVIAVRGGRDALRIRRALGGDVALWDRVATTATATAAPA